MSQQLAGFRYGFCCLLLLVVSASVAGSRTIPGPFGPTGERNEPTSLIMLAAQEQETSPEPQHASGSEPPESEEGEDGVLGEIFHWANFILILGGIWFLVRKFLVPFLEGRGRAIREDMERSSRAMEEANQRLSLIEEKMKRLDEEIGTLRQSASEEAAAERARIEEAANTDAKKVLTAAEQEMEAAVKAARQELKTYAAELALGVAENKIRESLTPQAEQRIFRSFLKELTSDEVGGGDGKPSQGGKS